MTSLRLNYSAISDVGRVRKNNQDSGYAGPWLLTVCDGVGGAARGDLASATAVQQLRRLDEQPSSDLAVDDLLGLVGSAMHRADDRIAELVEEDPNIAGTSTTSTVALFDGARLAIGHLGDSRAYLLRAGELIQLTHDHTFVQSLIDEGRITEEQARSHPHRNLILKAMDGVHENEPDLFEVPLQAGDRLLLCSDGACGVLSPERLADVLGSGTPDFAAVELIRVSLDAGSTDNVTTIVADVIEADTELPEGLEPLLVGAAAELPRRAPAAGPMTALFRGHRAGDTGEIEPVVADLPPNVHAIENDPLDEETARYAPKAPVRFLWIKRALLTSIFLGIGWIALATAWAWSQNQFYVGVHEGNVTIFRGLNTEIPGITVSHPYETSDIAIDNLSEIDAAQVTKGIEAGSLDEARTTVDNYAARQDASVNP